MEKRCGSVVMIMVLGLGLVVPVTASESSDTPVRGADTLLRPTETAVLPENGLVAIYDCSNATEISDTSNCGGSDLRVISTQKTIECTRKDADKMKKLINNSASPDKLKRSLRYSPGNDPSPENEYWLLATVVTHTPPVTRNIWCGGACWFSGLGAAVAVVLPVVAVILNRSLDFFL